VWVPGLERTKALKFWTKFGSASLLRPDRENSIPSAAWIRADAASAAFPLAGMRRTRTTGATAGRLRSRVFITLIDAHSGLAQDPKNASRAPEGNQEGIRWMGVQA